jgi:hypothetical protein
VPAQAPVAEVSEAMRVSGPFGHVRRFGRLARTPGYDFGGVDRRQVARPGVTETGKGPGDASHHDDGSPQPLVADRTLGYVGEQRVQSVARVAGKAGLAGVVENYRQNGQVEQLRFEKLGRTADFGPVWYQRRVSDERVVDGDVQCSGEGVQVSVRAGPSASGCVIPPLLDAFAIRAAGGRAYEAPASLRTTRLLSILRALGKLCNPVYLTPERHFFPRGVREVSWAFS